MSEQHLIPNPCFISVSSVAQILSFENEDVFSHGSARMKHGLGKIEKHFGLHRTLTNSAGYAIEDKMDFDDTQMILIRSSRFRVGSFPQLAGIHPRSVRTT